MPSPHDYDAMLASRKPFPFVLGKREFTARANIGHGRYTTLLMILQGAEEWADTSFDAKIRKFFDLTLTKDCREAMQELIGLDDPDDDDDGGVIVTRPQLDAIIDDLLAHYSGKAPAKDDSSTPGPVTTGAPSKPASLNSKVSLRRFFLIVQEVMVAEMRARQANLYHQSKFDGEKVETRFRLEALHVPPPPMTEEEKKAKADAAIAASTAAARVIAGGK